LIRQRNPENDADPKEQMKRIEESDAADCEEGCIGRIGPRRFQPGWNGEASESGRSCRAEYLAARLPAEGAKARQTTVA
jgi:hypothetical protein